MTIRRWLGIAALLWAVSWTTGLVAQERRPDGPPPGEKPPEKPKDSKLMVKLEVR